MARLWKNLIDAVELKASAAETTSTNGAEKSDARIASLKSGIAVLTVGPVSGTSPTLDVQIQGRDSASGTWETLATVPTITAAGTYIVNLEHFRSRMRYVSTIGGTSPSFTYSVVALALERRYSPSVGTVITS
jgi:hypothetical protein